GDVEVLLHRRHGASDGARRRRGPGAAGGPRDAQAAGAVLMPAAPEAAQARVEGLIRLTERLTELAAQQARAFETHRPHAAAARLDEVLRLANHYRQESAQVKQDPGLVSAAP